METNTLSALLAGELETDDGCIAPARRFRFAAQRIEAESAFRRLSLEHHPDHGGHDERMRELLEARRQAREELQGKGAAA